MGQFGLFTAEWMAEAMEGRLAYGDAPFFYPHRGTFAWSEPQPFTSGLVWFLSKLVGIIAAYNTRLLVYLAGAERATIPRNDRWHEEWPDTEHADA